MRTRLIISGLYLALACTGRLAAQNLESNQMAQRAVTLDSSSEVSKTLASAQDYVAESKWNEAIAQLRQIIDRDGEMLVAVAENRFVNASRYCQILVASWPKQAREEYRKQADPQARRWYREAVEQDDPKLLLKIVRNAFASSFGDDALWLLAEREFERGSLSTARHYWQQLVPIPAELQTPETPSELIYPDTDFSLAEIRARLILCSVFQGETRRAHDELRSFRGLHLDAKGSIAGRNGNLSEILDQVLSEANVKPPRHADSDFVTFAGSMDRNGICIGDVDVGAVRWAFPLVPDRFRTIRPRTALRDRGPLSFHPLVYRDLVLINDSDSVFALNLRTGKPAWPIDGFDDGSIFPEMEPERIVPIKDTAGVPFYSMTIADGRLYARMGTPVTMKAKDELRTANQLICLDLEHGQGKLLWSFEAKDLEHLPKNQLKVINGKFQLATPNWAFEGSPIVVGDRLFVAIKKSQRDRQTNVICMNAETKQILWNRKVCAALANLDDGFNYMSHSLLTYANGTVFYATGMGAVAAMNADDGVIQWVVTYPTPGVPDTATLSDHNKESLTPCLYYGGQLFVAARGSQRILAIDARSGTINWQRDLPDSIRHLIAVQDGRLFAGGDSLWCLNTISGRVEWRYLVNSHADAGYGRAVATQRSILWPTRKEIIEFDQVSGRIKRKLALRNSQGQCGGNLVVAGNALLVAQPDQLVVFGDRAGMRRKTQLAKPEFE